LFLQGADHQVTFNWRRSLRVAAANAPYSSSSRADQTARFFLPFARLRLITSRPDALLIRTRKPCVLFLLLL
jgi:hypothetical protein